MRSLNELTQILYEISIPMGANFDIQKMLRNVSLVTLRKLNATRFVTLELKKESNHIYYENIFSSPKSSSKCEDYIEFEHYLPKSSTVEEFDKFRQKLPIAISLKSGGGINVMELPDFGLLVLFRKKGCLQNEVIQSFLTITQKLSVACKSCQLHENLERLVEERTGALEERNSTLISERNKINNILEGTNAGTWD